MGLDFSHTDAHWSYSGFHLFREALARHEGFDLNEMDGFGRPWEDPEVHAARSWDEITTPLKPLLSHSDCDGQLSPEECRQVAPRLREVIDELWPGAGRDPFDRLQGLLLANGMECAASNDEPLEFC